jgi:S-adenosylmethionine:tRNA ribosyltransferase-isomerase
MNPYSRSSYLFDLPEELIAQYPCSPRDQSRLMVVERATGNIYEKRFFEIVDFLQSGDQLVFNNTKVIPARLRGKRLTGGSVEVFLTRRLNDDKWEALVRPAKKLLSGTQVTFSDDLNCKIVEELPEGRRIVQFDYKGDFDQVLAKHGQIPLPLYIHREVDPNTDVERYQTIYASTPGALAAPTAGLHFTREILEKLAEKEVYQTTVTLHVGIGTFRPVQVENITEHQMHSEHFIISEDAAQRLNNRDLSHRQICVGTTTCRTLESSCGKDGLIRAGEYDTDIFIYPGYQFKYVQSLLTNFHVPSSSLLMLVCAFAGYDLIMEAYAKAIKDRFRFFSYGDAMLIL